ncbi:MAG TPA: 2-succinyl-5-enolpyruvyl-6-hydroxy-3-cyclohexene-1-carboxylate synthase, partial [Rhodothermales bacterium]|nr:2-succinyl-5-enolpyruvyl-6-hydroxy-3-cyclohexene-1-carboxylate synthase [Rhodothermales bacterium]
QFEDVFEPFFGTPHGLSFEHAAALFGIRYEHPATLEDFVAAYRTAQAESAPAIIEVTTDRKENHALHQRLQQYLSEIHA